MVELREDWSELPSRGGRTPLLSNVPVSCDTFAEADNTSALPVSCDTSGVALSPAICDINDPLTVGAPSIYPKPALPGTPYSLGDEDSRRFKTGTLSLVGRGVFSETTGVREFGDGFLGSMASSWVSASSQSSGFRVSSTALSAGWMGVALAMLPEEGRASAGLVMMWLGVSEK